MKLQPTPGCCAVSFVTDFTEEEKADPARTKTQLLNKSPLAQIITSTKKGEKVLEATLKELGFNPLKTGTHNTLWVIHREDLKAARV